MTADFGRETVVENSPNIFCRNTNTIVPDGELHLANFFSRDTERDDFFRLPAILGGIFCVADEIDENLQYLAPIA